VAIEGEPESEGDQLCHDLAKTFDNARAELERELVSCIRLAARKHNRGDWRAAAFVLERRYQKEWCRLVGEARQEAVDLMLEALKDMLPEEDFARVRRQLARRVSEG